MLRHGLAHADPGYMDSVIAVAATQVQTMLLNDARRPLEQLKADPIPADAPPAAHAAVILELSSAAKSLTTS